MDRRDKTGFTVSNWSETSPSCRKERKNQARILENTLRDLEKQKKARERQLNGEFQMNAKLLFYKMQKKRRRSSSSSSIENAYEDTWAIPSNDDVFSAQSGMEKRGHMYDKVTLHKTIARFNAIDASYVPSGRAESSFSRADSQGSIQLRRQIDVVENKVSSFMALDTEENNNDVSPDLASPQTPVRICESMSTAANDRMKTEVPNFVTGCYTEPSDTSIVPALTSISSPKLTQPRLERGSRLNSREFSSKYSTKLVNDQGRHSPVKETAGTSRRQPATLRRMFSTPLLTARKEIDLIDQAKTARF
ncbi:uncharacterized protein LOC100374180 [Saccoglossus kowalevskii]|uniref:Uncharacterized protein LOC100374180 n=1 Tax=Saccoglossus kowalevskii TaxID=10224 RepID=A0ABM0GU78_SACKO|nr:PREDICTED: uncharacterized protein LOC100374180 [Saccoglossus kowalevskii]